jgi:hypothetical protein
MDQTRQGGSIRTMGRWSLFSKGLSSLVDVKVERDRKSLSPLPTASSNLSTYIILASPRTQTSRSTTTAATTWQHSYTTKSYAHREQLRLNHGSHVFLRVCCSVLLDTVVVLDARTSARCAASRECAEAVARCTGAKRELLRPCGGMFVVQW